MTDRYQIRDPQGRKIQVIIWDGAADLGDQFAGQRGEPDDGSPLWEPPAVVAMPDISDRQFARGLWGDGLIGYGNFLGFVGPGVIPAAIQAVVSPLPDDDTGRPTPRKEAVGFLTGAKSYSFTHPLVEAFRAAMAASDPRWTLEYLRAR
ncbi:hypothetical protein [Methylobacterium aquaticum]|uniref:hypothetical protein n=1 Tax=Methylobacterium aquaticum TaxID=270351 RepID=UPI001932FDD4|nr:hypothetical protein [Methylobacterium aquaticum]QRE76144.1 hypothetical protein F1D61_23550 [Methylobacterium aquaticum]